MILVSKLAMLNTLDDNEISSAVRLITSRGDLRQDVCGLLRRMSLTDDGVSSLAVRYAMNAISYLYLKKADEATLHQMHAVAALQGAIDRIKDPRCRAQAIAASLLLSLYEVCSDLAALLYTICTYWWEYSFILRCSVQVARQPSGPYILMAV